MAELTTNTLPVSGFSIKSVFDRILNTFIQLGENTTRARAIEALSEMSDQELAAKGTTRKDEVLRILNVTAFI